MPLHDCKFLEICVGKFVSGGLWDEPEISSLEDRHYCMSLGPLTTCDYERANDLGMQH